MMRSNYLASVVLAGVALALVSRPAAAEDKKDGKPALSGTWAKKAGEMTIEFADKGVLKLRPHGDNLAFVIVCKYTAEKAVVKGEITEIEAAEQIKQKEK